MGIENYLSWYGRCSNWQNVDLSQIAGGRMWILNPPLLYYPQNEIITPCIGAMRDMMTHDMTTEAYIVTTQCARHKTHEF